LVQNSIKSKYVEKLKEAVLSLNIGDPMNPEVQMGPCVSDKAAKHIAAQVSKTIEQGATLALGGDRKGAFYSPTILDNVTPEMDVAKDMEIFGPVFPVIGFGNEQEAVKVANRTCYGLNGGVISEDLAHGIAVAKKIQAGTVVAYGDARQHHSAVIR
jgi:succinate-semialdehyde dehydrogenase/glutarate-semialdehyde dehydrogenase